MIFRVVRKLAQVSIVLSQCTRLTTRRTERLWQYRALHYVQSRGKNDNFLSEDSDINADVIFLIAIMYVSDKLLPERPLLLFPDDFSLLTLFTEP